MDHQSFAEIANSFEVETPGGTCTVAVTGSLGVENPDGRCTVDETGSVAEAEWQG